MVQEGVVASPSAKEVRATVSTASGGGAAVQQPQEEELLSPRVRKERSLRSSPTSMGQLSRPRRPDIPLSCLDHPLKRKEEPAEDN
ncbi:UNVERIFIED_CONTAM: hypothetical protein FKN15_015842 [Acipenser sinensis]